MSWGARHRDAIRDELWLLRLSMGFLLVLAVLAIWFSFADDSEPTELKAGADLRLALADLVEGKLYWFTYPVDSSTRAQFVVQRGKDKILRAAFASCRRCYGSRHYEMFTQLICGHCGHAMKLPNPGDQPTTETGCIPVSVQYSIESDQLVVRSQTVTGGFHRWFRPIVDTKTN